MKQMLTFLFLLSFAFINAITIYVDHTATGSNAGSSWANAFTTLQAGLNLSSSDDEIWVAKGTYKPSEEIDGTTDTPREFTFQMINDVSIYGGFAGTETILSQRTDYGPNETNETILSGDFDGDDVITGSGATLVITNNSENAYHVFHHLSTSGLTTSAKLDGFTIVGGNANGSANPWNDGGAIYNRTGQTPTINNCYFTGNSASDNGGAIMNISSTNVTITNCTFTLNYATDAGGAMGNYESSAIITNCLFYGNRTADDGNGGGLFNYEVSNVAVTNCTFTENSSKSGGGVYNSANSDITMVNSIVYGNTITTGWGTQIRNYTDSELTLSYSDIEVGGINNSNGGTTVDGGGNIESDPLFVGSGDYPYLIFGVSLCVDAGYNDATTETTDIRGGTYGRKLSKVDGSAGTIDMGAYEYKFDDDPLPVILSSFTVSYTDNSAILNWTTQSETDNLGFNVYRSISQNLGQSILLNVNGLIEGAGNSTEPTDYIFVDMYGVEENFTYYYWIESVNNAGETEMFGPVSLTIPLDETNQGTPIAPDSYGLQQNYPNPFNPSTSISFALQEDSNVELIIYNIKGRKIRSIFNDHISADQIQTVIWDGNDASNKQVSSGVYFYKLITDKKVYMNKMLLIK